MTPISTIGTLLYKLSQNNSPHKRTLKYAQVEALNLTKKDNETVRHFALKVQQLVEKAGVMRMHPLLTLNVMKSLQKDSQKILETLQTKGK